MMTKKNYIAIGQALGAAFVATNQEAPAYYALNKAAQEIANVFAADNPSFNRERFLHFVSEALN